ncbi:Arf GTPase arl1 [Mitosporidium daphniae]
MGILFSRLFSSIWGEREFRVLILGLDGAGKTTILYKLQLGEILSTIPTIGFNMETLSYKNLKFQVWDLGGQSTIRHEHVDAADVDRVSISKAELALVLEEEDLKGCALLVLANKQDLPGALNSQELTKALGLSAVRERLYAVFNASAIQGQGLFEGLDWLVTAVQKPKGSSSHDGGGEELL